MMVEVKIIFFNLYMDKYYLYIVNNKKSILLSSSDSKIELREKGLQNIGDKIEKYNGLYLYRVKIIEVPKKDLNTEIKPRSKSLINSSFEGFLFKKTLAPAHIGSI